MNPPGAPRFPFPTFPRGWFVIAFSTDIAPGEVKTLRYFGEDIVVFRGEDGGVSAVHKTCPHLGAHLGGGEVIGNCLRCPFHHWSFDQAGRCVDVPYAPKIPPRAAVRTWAIREQNGVILCWYCPKGEGPTWEPDRLEDEGWTPIRMVRWELASHPQEVAENTVDCSHLGPVHHVNSTEVLSVEQGEHRMRVVLNMVTSGAQVGMPDEINDVELDVNLQGLGMVISTTQVKNAELCTRQRIYPTPIEGDKLAIFAAANIRIMADPGYTAEIDQIFWDAFNADFPRDFPIWGKKAYLDKPLLAGGDGPIGRYRRWCRRFYDYPVEAAASAGEGAAAAAEASAPAGKTRRRERVRRWLRRVVGRAGVGPGRAPGAGNEQEDEEEDEPFVPRAPSVRPPPPPSETRFDSVESYFETLERRFDPAAAGDLDAVFQWVLSGEGERACYAVVRGGAIETQVGVHPSPTVTIEMSAPDYLMMINGELHGARAFASGRGRLRGPVRLAMKMQRIFPLEREV